MAVGALRAAGLAAAALGYHVWRLLTKQNSAEDIEDYDQVSVQGSHCCRRLFTTTQQVTTQALQTRGHDSVIHRVCEAIPWALRSSCPHLVETVHKLLAQVPEAVRSLPG